MAAPTYSFPWGHFTTGFPASSTSRMSHVTSKSASILGLDVWVFVAIVIAAVILLILILALLIAGCRYCCSSGGIYGGGGCGDCCCGCCGSGPYRGSLFGKPVKTEVYEVPATLAPTGMSSHVYGRRQASRNIDRPIKVHDDDDIAYVRGRKTRKNRFGRRKVLTEYIDREEPDMVWAAPAREPSVMHAPSYQPPSIYGGPTDGLHSACIRVSP